MTGELDINGNDAFTTYGIGLEKGAIASLLTPAPMKEYISNNSRLNHGTQILPTSAKVNQREITIQFHMFASSESTFMANYTNFTNVLASGKVILHEKKYTNKYYRCFFVSCTAYQHNINGLSKFTLKLIEPDPTDRGSVTTHSEMWT